MTLSERLYSVLLVSSAEKFNSSLTGLLTDAGCRPAVTVASVGAAKRELLERSYDIVLINAPLPDDMGITFAIDVCTGSSSAALLFIRSELYGETYARVTGHGVMTLPKPTSTQMVAQAIGWLCATRERLRGLERKTVSAQEKLEEIRLVNRAKWVLIDELKMTENEAHRYIEKKAMDSCCSKREVAEGIIKTYGSRAR